MSKFRRAVLALVCLATALSGVAGAATATAATSDLGDTAAPWPASWNVYKYADGSSIRDVNTDQSPAGADISSGPCVGSGCTGPDASVYYYSDGSTVFFRLHLATDPTDLSKGGLFGNAYLAQIAVGPSNTIAAVVGVNGKPSAADYVYTATAPGTSVAQIYTFPFDNTGGESSAGMRVVPDGFGQYFLDWQVPFARLQAAALASGVGTFTTATPVKLYYGSSAAANLATINKDFMAGDVSSADFSNLAVVSLAPAAASLTASASYVSGSNPPAATATTRYSVTLTAGDTGGGELTSGTVTATLPSGVSYVSGSTAAGSVSASGSTVTWTVGTIPALASSTATLTLDLTPTAGMAGSTTQLLSSIGLSATDAPAAAIRTASAADIVVGPVDAAPQTISFSPLSDRTLAAPSQTLSATASSALPVTFTSATPATCTVSGTTVTGTALGTCTVTASQAGNGSYTAAPPVQQSFQVTKVAQTVTFPTPDDATVTDGTTSLSATSDSGLTVSFSSSTTGVCTVSGTTVTLLSAGTCTVTATQPGDGTYAAAAPVSQSFAVATADQTITFPAPSDVAATDGTTSVSASSDSGLTVSFSSATPGVCTVSGTTVTLLAAGTCTIDADQAGDAAYDAATTVTRSFTVVPSSQTITFALPGDLTLDSPTESVSAGATSGLPVTLTSDTPAVCSVSGGTVTGLSAGTCTVTATQPGDASYAAAAPVSRSFAVATADQTITFPAPSDVAVTDGTTSVSASSDSGLTVSFSSSTTGVCTVSGTTVTLLTAGTCTIDADQPGNGTYAAAAPVAHSFTVTPAGLSPQTITFPAPSDVAATDGTTSVSASSDSGLTVSFSSATPGVCTVSGTTVTLLAAGTCTIDADQAGDAAYDAATTVTRSFTVVPSSQTITFALPGDLTLDSPTESVSAGATSGLPVTLTSDTPAVCSVSGGTVTGLSAGTCTVTATQPGDASYAAAAPVSRSFAVATADQTITFPAPSDVAVTDGTTSVSASSDSGLTVSFSSSTTGVCTVSGTTVTLLTAGTCTIDADQPGNGTYAAAAPVAHSFTVTPAGLSPQTIVFAAPVDSALGSSPVTLVAGADSLLPVTFTSLTPAVCTVSAGHVTLLATGTCSVQATQDGDATYGPATPVTRSFTVSPATVTPPAPPAPTPPAADPIAVAVSVSGGSGGAVTVRPLPTGSRIVPVSCEVTAGPAATGCTVTLYATVDGQRVVVGTGTASDPTGAGSNLPVVVTLTAAGRRLVARPGGVVVHVRADITVAGSPVTHRAATATRLVTRHQLVPRPVFFATSSSALRPHARAHLERLRHRLAGVRVVTCIGYTDGRGAANVNHALGMRRAVAACAVLTRGLNVKVRLVTRGENRPFASNATRHGRQLNRRTAVRLIW